MISPGQWRASLLEGVRKEVGGTALSRWAGSASWAFSLWSQGSPAGHSTTYAGAGTARRVPAVPALQRPCPEPGRGRASAVSASAESLAGGGTPPLPRSVWVLEWLRRWPQASPSSRPKLSEVGPCTLTVWKRDPRQAPRYISRQTIREKRIVESANKRETDYEVGDIPTEWEAWIRKTRKTPPTMEEIMKNEKYKEEIKMKTKDFYEKGKLLREESNKEHLAPPVQTQIKGHASAPYFGKEESSVAPTSTGKTFQPGSWMPQDGKSHNQ
ncbi:NADH dehydrogenase [ubiquinone] 1 alpha subcomplex assembly factor 2 [Physeter macrocephalus]|uniref:NADH dehydrogenase [ubiquinone] 1 alpha subcomplex assembly factor 2 n=1 Tax=Physeter macrocephalus TaxID=9755 RepID=A0A9W2WUC8_PHYMC|nr:NADH dehydrogenase [ubiquinone] 1 alpha subcomplex assembly factor 2 [Physeter catodon]